MSMDKLLEDIEGMEVPEAYDLTMGEVHALRAVCENDRTRGILDAFLLGFSRGQQAANAERQGIQVLRGGGNDDGGA